MKLALRARSINKRVTLFATAFVLAVSSLTASVPFILSSQVNALPGAGTHTITGNTAAAENTEGWMFNRDLNNATPIEFVHGEGSTGTGALHVKPISNTIAAKKFIGENFIFTPMSSLSSISVDYKLGPATTASHVYLNVYANYAASADTYYYDCRYDVVASTGSTSSYSTLTFNPNSSHTVTTRAGSATCPSTPSAMGEGAKVRAYAINLGGTSLSDAGMSAHFDNSVVATTAGNVVYDFEGAQVNTASTQFVNDPKYVRAGNGTDIAAQIVTPDETTNVRFFLNGNTATPYSGVNVGGAGATTSWWRLATPLPAGEYTVTAEVFVSGKWWSVADSAKVYSLDTPTAQYILPTATNSTFRPSDNPVRLKIEDQFEQFSRVVIKIGAGSYEVTRAQCDLRQAGNYVLCDVSESSTWNPLASGAHPAPVSTVYTKANNRLDNFAGQAFVVDGTKPVITNFSAPAGPVKSGFVVSATAEDAESGIESVNFYIVELRADGACTGNGTKLFEQRVSSATSGVYATTVNTDLNGEYCLVAVARNNAWGNSDSERQKIVIDTDGPVVEIENVVVSNTKKLSFDLTATDNLSGLQIVSANIYNASNTGNPVITLGAGNPTRLNVPHSGLAAGTLSFSTSISDIDVSGLASGTYTIRAFARDHVGLEHRFLLVQFTVDNTAPVATVLAANYLTTDSQLVTGTTEPGSTVALSVDGVPEASGIVPDASGNWSYVLSPARAQGVYGLSVVATDAAGNTTDSADAGFATLLVSLPFPDTNQSGGPEGDPVDPVATPNTAQNQNNEFPLPIGPQGQLGVSTENNDDDSEGGPSVEGSSIERNVAQAVGNNDGSAFGLAWYWWVLIAAGVATIIWWIIAAIRRRDTA